MGLTFKNTRMSDTEVMEIASIVFVKMAQDGELDNSTILAHPSVFQTWNSGWRGKKGSILMHEGVLYRAKEDITGEGEDTSPTDAPTLWEKIESVGEDDV